MKVSKIIITILSLQCIFLNNIAAQSSNPDFMQSIGKIYVVVAVIVTVFIGIIIYLFSLQNKIKQLEDQIREV